MTAVMLQPSGDIVTDKYGPAILSAVLREQMNSHHSFVVGRIVEICNESGAMVTHSDVGHFLQGSVAFEHVNGSGKGERFRLVGALP